MAGDLKPPLHLRGFPSAMESRIVSQMSPFFLRVKVFDPSHRKETKTPSSTDLRVCNNVRENTRRDRQTDTHTQMHACTCTYTEEHKTQLELHSVQRQLSPFLLFQCECVGDHSAHTSVSSGFSTFVTTLHGRTLHTKHMLAGLCFKF